MRDRQEQAEAAFFALFLDFFDSEKDAGKQHNPENYTLDRMLPLAKLAGVPIPYPLKVIHVAGTKGKGSTCFFLDALLRAAGFNTFTFTSPHLDTVRERFQSNGQLASYQLLTDTANPILQNIRQAGLKPSLFEIFTVLALRLACDAHADFLVLETGIGGRLDATNFLPAPLATVITPVSYDHMALLGNSIRQIAAEKAGILKPGVPLTLARQPYLEGEQTILQRAKQLGCPVLNAADTRVPTAFGTSSLPPFLQDNFQVAWTTVARTLKLSPSPANFQLPTLRARFETICHDPLVIIDAAHNGDSLTRLVEALRLRYPDLRFTVILGMVQGKDIARSVAALGKLPADFLLTNPHTTKGSALPELETAARQTGLHLLPTIPNLTSREQLPANTPLLFTGSFFTALIAEELFPHN